MASARIYREGSTSEMLKVLLSAGASADKLPDHVSWEPDFEKDSAASQPEAALLGQFILPNMAEIGNQVQNAVLESMLNAKRKRDRVEAQKSETSSVATQYDAADTSASYVKFHEDMTQNLERKHLLTEKIDYAQKKTEEAKIAFPEKVDDVRLELSRDVLEALLRERNLNQRELAEACQIDTASMSRYMNGGRVPTYKHAIVISVLYLNKDDGSKYLRFIGENSRGGKRKEELRKLVERYLETDTDDSPFGKDQAARKEFLVDHGLFKL